MNDIIVDSDIESGSWPEAFEGAWGLVFNDVITLDSVFCVFFDSDNDSGTILEYPSIPLHIRIPDAYVSWRMNPQEPERNGECREIFVGDDFRRRGVGTKLCAWARSYAKNNQNVLFRAPSRMTPAAQSMFESISDIYGEEYTNPEEFPPTIPYSYWGGKILKI
jgi:GNAT superfamily N-acetyltransferase